MNTMTAPAATARVSPSRGWGRYVVTLVTKGLRSRRRAEYLEKGVGNPWCRPEAFWKLLPG
jgi:hypothetical protein